MLRRGRRASAEGGRALYAAAAAQARRPAFYTGGGVADTANARFELYTLHVVLLLRRLRSGGDRAAETSQALFDAYIGGLDEALREQGVGDLSMAKQMRRLGEAFYGRVKSYDDAFDQLPEASEVRAIIARTVLAGHEGADGRDAPDAGSLTAYAAEAVARLAALPEDALLEGRIEWPAIPA